MSLETIITVLPNLSIGVVAVIGIIYISREFTKTIDKQAERNSQAVFETSKRHEAAMMERENALREVERDVRTNILAQMQQNTETMKETTKTLEHVMMMLTNRK